MARDPLHNDFFRTLYHVSIIHTQSDLGALNKLVMQASIQKLGLSGIKRKMEVVDQLWSTIELFTDNLNIPFKRVRIYQDGLPVCGKETDIIKDLAKAGSRNHRLLLQMFKKGAMVMGTESAELLVEEYELYKQILIQEQTNEVTENKTGLETLSESLLKKRDSFIADRINHTLHSGETGILFLGLLHAIEHMLDKDIQVIYPLNHFSFE